jgi:nitrous oxidase accessory protein NosD
MRALTLTLGQKLEERYMSRHLAWFFLAVVMLAVSAPLQALNYEVGGCKTGSSYVNFTTISAAVVGVPAGATIQICPGVYPEQVTITQPLTLKGIGFNNANRAVITINPNGSLAPNVTSSINFVAFYAQVLVQNVNPAGPVNIIGITVDGSGDNAGCSAEMLAGIFYASSTSGTVNEVTARNQVNGGCGWGIWVENGAASSQTITIENSSVHNGGFDGGGIAASSVSPPTLSSTISGNFLSNAGLFGIDDSSSGVIAGNVLTSVAGPGIFAEVDPLTVSANTVADILGIGIETKGANTVVANKLSNVGDSIALFPDVAATIKSNTIKNTFCGIDFSGGSNSGTISGNTLNDSPYAFGNWFGPTIGGNSLYNVDNLQSTSGSCP